MLQGEREEPGAVVLLPSLPPLFIGPLGGAPALGDPISKGGGGQGGGLPPKPSGAPPTPRVSNPRRRGRPKGGAPAQQVLVPLPLQPMGPSGIGGPTWWTPRDPSGGPGTIPITPETFPMAET